MNPSAEYQMIDGGSLRGHHIETISDLPGFDQTIVDALVAAPHRHWIRTITRASSLEAVRTAQQARVDVPSHAPLDRALAVGELVGRHAQRAPSSGSCRRSNGGLVGREATWAPGLPRMPWSQGGPSRLTATARHDRSAPKDMHVRTARVSGGRGSPDWIPGSPVRTMLDRQVEDLASQHGVLLAVGVHELRLVAGPDPAVCDDKRLTAEIRRRDSADGRRLPPDDCAQGG